MRSPKRWLPRGTDYDERAVALAKQLGIDMPPPPLSNAQLMSLWVEVGKKLLPFEQPEPATLRQLWAEIGMCLAELREPEFQWGPGRLRGRANKELYNTTNSDTLYKRRKRAALRSSSD